YNVRQLADPESRKRRAVMDPRAAFARARSFLNYHAVAKWSSLAAAIGTALLYVALLMVLGLYADLMVNRGHIPALNDLSAVDREAFQEEWKGPLKPPEPVGSADGKELNPWKNRLKRHDLPDNDDTAKRVLHLRNVLTELGFKDAEADQQLNDR